MIHLHQARPQREQFPLCIKTGETMNTARDQFVSDFTLVVDNNYEAYTDTLNSLGNQLPANSDQIRHSYESAIYQALEVLRQNKNIEEVTVDLISQVMLGWGADEFDDIARHYMGIKTESEVA
jgi:hypothetical protein